MLIARIVRLALVAIAAAVLGVAAILVANTPVEWPLGLVLALLLVPVVVATVLAIEFLAGIFLGDGHWRGLGQAWLGEVLASMRTYLLAVPLSRPLSRPLAGPCGPVSAPLPDPWSGSVPPGSAGARTGGGARLAVVLVHGYFCNHAIWRPLARHLGRAGHRVHAVDLEPAFGSIDDYAATIAEAVIVAGVDGRPVVLVGHSMGGLAIRAYLRRAGGSAVAGMITLGSPHRGTRAATLGQTANTRQMRRNSAWLAALEAHERSTTAPPCSVILTRNDNIVYPQAEQVLPGAHVVTVDGIGHLSLVYHPAAWRLIDGELRRLEAVAVGVAVATAAARMARSTDMVRPAG